MLATVRLISKSLLVAGALSFLFVGAVTPGLARGGGHGGSSGYFPGITNCCGGGGNPGGAAGGFEARDVAGARYHDQSCNPNFSQPLPYYCRGQ